MRAVGSFPPQNQSKLANQTGRNHCGEPSPVPSISRHEQLDPAFLVRVVPLRVLKRLKYWGKEVVTHQDGRFSPPTAWLGQSVWSLCWWHFLCGCLLLLSFLLDFSTTTGGYLVSGLILSHILVCSQTSYHLINAGLFISIIYVWHILWGILGLFFQLQSVIFI